MQYSSQEPSRTYYRFRVSCWPGQIQPWMVEDDSALIWRFFGSKTELTPSLRKEAKLSASPSKPNLYKSLVANQMQSATRFWAMTVTFPYFHLRFKAERVWSGADSATTSKAKAERCTKNPEDGKTQHGRLISSPDSLCLGRMCTITACLCSSPGHRSAAFMKHASGQ